MNRPGPRPVVVAGGGPAGAAAAIALAGAGVPVTLVAPARAAGSGMLETLPPGAQPVLERLGAWEGFVAAGHTRLEASSSAWGDGDVEWRDAFTQPMGSGWYVDRDHFDAALVKRAERLGTVVVDGTVAGVEREGGRIRSVTVRGSDSVDAIPATFVVDATGRGAAVAHAHAVPRARADRLTCVYGSFRPASSSSAHMVVETVEEGWWYAAADGSGAAVAAFFSDADVLRSLSAARLDEWRLLLSKTHYVTELVGATEPATLMTRSASSECRIPAGGEGWAAAGDAASTLDPLTSSGIVTALRSGVEVAEVALRTLDGDAAATTDHDRNVRRRFARYLIDRASYYGMEKRWPTSPFWRRRVVSGANLENAF